MDKNHFSEIISVFHECTAPEEGYTVDYATLMNRYELQIPGEELR